MPAPPPRKAKAAKRRASLQSDTEPTNGVRRDLLAADVLKKAAILFALRGFAATSLKDVADAVGLQRSSIYYYYPNKESLLKELIQGATLPVAQIFREVEAEKLSALGKIREVVRRLVIWVGDPNTHFRLLVHSEAELPAAFAKLHRDAKRNILGEMVGLIEKAVLAGEARATDTRVTALSIIGMAMWTAWWFQADKAQSLEDVAELIADNAISIVQRRKPAKQVGTVADVTREIRESLALIDRLAER